MEGSTKEGKQRNETTKKKEAADRRRERRLETGLESAPRNWRGGKSRLGYTIRVRKIGMRGNKWGKYEGIEL
jgi:hypothetical protein